MTEKKARMVSEIGLSDKTRRILTEFNVRKCCDAADFLSAVDEVRAKKYGHMSLSPSSSVVKMKDIRETARRSLSED